MKADGRCPHCHRPVRQVIRDEDGTQLIMDPTGWRYVVGYEDGVPVVKMAASRDDVPKREPLRYTRHICER